MMKLRALLFLMVATVVGGVYAVFMYPQSIPDTYHDFGVDLTVDVDAAITPIMDISVTPNDDLHFYLYETEGRKVGLGGIGAFNVNCNWNVSEAEKESYVNQEVISIYFRVESIEGVEDLIYGQYDLSPIEFSAEEYFMGNIAFDEEGNLSTPEDDLGYYLLFELQNFCSEGLIYLNEDLPALENYDMCQTFLNCFINPKINVEIIFRAAAVQ